MTDLDAPAHPFDLAVELSPALRGYTRPEYGNMVGPFGGVTAAILVRAVEQHPDRLGDPLALTVNYLAPLADGEFSVTAHAVRTNRTTQHWQLELVQGDTVTTTATAVFGLRRDTWADTETTMPAAPEPETLEPHDFGGFAAWMANYDVRFIEGAMPAEDTEGQADSTTTLWMRDEPSRPLDYPALTALCDVFIPRVFLRRGRASLSSTVSLTVYFHADADDLAAAGGDFVLGTARGHRYGGGFFDQTAHLWSRPGALLATTHQLSYFKG